MGKRLFALGMRLFANGETTSDESKVTLIRMAKRLEDSIFWIFAGISLLTAGSAFAQSAVRPNQPNFIVINVDDLGYADIEPFGSTKNRTPNLTAMAKEGRKLTSFYAAPVCSPSRASLMTGCYPKRSLPIAHVLFPASNIGLHPNEITLAEILNSLGYATGIIGKWHLGDQPDFLPTRQGFDYFFGLPYSNDMGPAADGVKSNLGQPLPKTPQQNPQPPLPLLRNETVLQRVLPSDQQAFVERYTEEAVQFLWQHRNEPFFLYLPHSAVHWPLYPGKRFAEPEKNELLRNWVEEVDWSVGQILSTVRQLQLEEKTFVIFTSDNGGPLAHGAVNSPFHGGKGTTFEGGMRVPTIAWWPGQIPPNTETSVITSMMDILPTFTKLAGGELPNDRKLDGIDIWPVLTGDSALPEFSERRFYFFRGLKLNAVRSGPWKLHLDKGDLFQLDEDPAESKNVAEKHPEIVSRLREFAEEMDRDLGKDGLGTGCRELGKVDQPQPLIAHDGKVRTGFEAPQVFAGQGIVMGELTSNSVYVQMRLTATERLVDGDLPGASGLVRFALYDETGEKQWAISPVREAKATDDYIVREFFDGLQADTRYLVKTEMGPARPDNSGDGTAGNPWPAPFLFAGPQASFRTLPAPDQRGTIRFVVVTGMNYAKFHGDEQIDRQEHRIQNNTELPPPYTKPDKHLGYPALETIRRFRPDFFVGTGDNVYYDTPSKPRAETISQMRRKWHEQFVQPRYKELFSSVPTFWMIDDHDYRVDDCDNEGDYAPSVVDGRRLMFEQLPYGPQGATPQSYRTYRVSRDLQIWFTENRLHRSPNRMPDGPGKSIWGTEQLQWLQRTLMESDATFKLLISPTPMVGPDDLRKTDNHTNIGGFRHERDRFFDWLNQTKIAQRNFFIICGDRHWQYHARDPAGIEEFSCGALVDANSRLGRKPGDPKSTDPEAKIHQFYTQEVASGGFLQVELSYGTGELSEGTPPAISASQSASFEGAAQLTFSFHNEQGELLYRVRRTHEQ